MVEGGPERRGDAVVGRRLPHAVRLVAVTGQVETPEFLRLDPAPHDARVVVAVVMAPVMPPEFLESPCPDRGEAHGLQGGPRGGGARGLRDGVPGDGGGAAFVPGGGLLADAETFNPASGYD